MFQLKPNEFLLRQKRFSFDQAQDYSPFLLNIIRGISKIICAICVFQFMITENTFTLKIARKNIQKSIVKE